MLHREHAGTLEADAIRDMSEAKPINNLRPFYAIAGASASARGSSRAGLWDCARMSDILAFLHGMK